MAFSHIRSKHDEIYRDEAFPRVVDQHFLENMPAVDKFKIGDDYNPKMRTLSEAGTVVGINDGKPNSTYLKSLDELEREIHSDSNKKAEWKEKRNLAIEHMKVKGKMYFGINFMVKF